MRIFKAVFAAFMLLAAGLAGPAWAGKDDPLFVNLSSDDPHRAMMAVRFSEAMSERGHPVTIFLNDKGVMVAATAKEKEFSAEQKMLAGLMDKGVVVIACQHCMTHYGVKDDSLLKGVKLGTPELVGEALFKDDTRSITW